MLNIEESQLLMEKFIALRAKANETKNAADIKEFKKHEKECVEKFGYLVTMKTSRYKSFANYEDLNQEGYEAMLKGLKNYDPKKGNIFWWLHHYVATRISRAANLHTAIRYPLKVAKLIAPHKEILMPLQIEDKYIPEKELNISQLNQAVLNSVKSLDAMQENIINLAFGINGNEQLSVNKICRKLKVSRSFCLRTIKNSLALMRENIKI